MLFRSKKTALLNVPRYDFNWQLGYELAQPVKAPKGSKIILTSHFDNSVNNKYNPDPSKDVLWGDQNWEEMQSGFLGLTFDVNTDYTKAFLPSGPSLLPRGKLGPTLADLKK